MILLESENVIIRELLTACFAEPSAVDQTFTDFDGVSYHLEGSKTGPITLSIDLRCWRELEALGAIEVLRREYGAFLRAQSENEYSVTLELDYAKIPADQASRQALVHKLSLLKRNIMAAPFERAFEIQKSLAESLAASASAQEGSHSAPPQGAGEIMSINYRDDEAIYIVPGNDRVTVVFSTTFKDETDRIFGKVFLQEFVDARRQPSIQNAPQVLYSNREPPLEIRSIRGLNRSESVGYVTFVLFPRHFQNPDVTFTTISHIQLFRDYLHYHIKCSKAYMHSRMRHRVAEFLKILNRAKPEQAEKERKTASGRSFRRA
ncbi:putative ARC35-subunit of the Arp2/3 complex [Ceraceosorus guamensis]|uniref:Arp2/3 complex 34 kDa subunit n=1 Tax=Ceraceosorus guamensis TaxID=1522189 RepID=A0A316VYM3_9BASI|nr:putative ARC35-subunit of the Arp2/3 complex [Ceraceosorus guamensis]PWN40575.1 putative ARC35-subunit of the Arp2/3 complex [Ceraceosorus guamensis]